MSPVHHFGKSKKRMNERLRFSTFRVKCWLWIEDSVEPIPGFGFASDISEAGIGIFLDRKVNVGVAVRVAIDEENAPPFPGYVAWCQRFSLEQRFHGHEALDHRLGIRYAFASESERQRYLIFFSELKQRVTLLSGGPSF
jgi:hypothetical protein